MNQSEKDHPFLTLLIPSYNEEENLKRTLLSIIQEIQHNKIEDIEILVINDHSQDNSSTIINDLAKEFFFVHEIHNSFDKGYGLAIRCGLEHFKGENVAIVMADLSDSPKDIIRYYGLLKEKKGAIFGSRFIEKGSLTHYPVIKLLCNRCGNYLIHLYLKLFFNNYYKQSYNDFTNAFKAFSRKQIEWMINNHLFLSQDFDLTVELSLSTILSKTPYTIIPIRWNGRVGGKSNFKIVKIMMKNLKLLFYFLRNHKRLTPL